MAMQASALAGRDGVLILKTSRSIAVWSTDPNASDPIDWIAEVSLSRGKFPSHSKVGSDALHVMS